MGRSRWIRVRDGLISLVAISTVTTGISVCAIGDPETAAWVRERACTTGPLGMSPAGQRQYHRLPFGLVRSCRMLDYDPRLFSEVDASTHLLLGTDSGLVLVRVDYHDLDMGYYWYAVATELAPGESRGGMSDEERRQHRRDVAGRGGVLSEPWTVKHAM